MMFEMAGQHAEEDMGADMIGGIDMDGADPQTCLFHGSKGTFNAGESFVGPHSVGCGDGCGIEVGADHIDTVECRLDADSVGCALLGQGRITDDEIEMFSDRLPVDLAPDPASDLFLSLQPS